MACPGFQRDAENPGRGWLGAGSSESIAWRGTRGARAAGLAPGMLRLEHPCSTGVPAGSHQPRNPRTLGEELHPCLSITRGQLAAPQEGTVPPGSPQSCCRSRGTGAGRGCQDGVAMLSLPPQPCRRCVGNKS